MGEPIDANVVYTLGSSEGESVRLLRQADELTPAGEMLLDRAGLRAGHSAVDLGCGPHGVLELLAARVSPGGRVVGVDADPAHVAMAAGFAAERGLEGVEVMAADARSTGLPSGSFDLVHSHADPAGQRARAGAGGRRDGAAGPARRPGRVPGTRLRVRAVPSATVRVFPKGHSRRTILLDLVRSMRSRVLELGLAGGAELDELDAAARAHLDDPHTVVMSHPFFLAWGRKPA